MEQKKQKTTCGLTRLALIAVFTIAVSAIVFGPLALNGYSSANRQQVRLRKVATVKTLVTAYCPCRICCGRNSNGITSTGRNAFRNPGVAADPKAIPYGAWVNIPGVGYRQVDDTGGAMKKAWRKNRIVHLDLRFPSHRQALEWGRKWLAVDVFAVQ